MEGCYSNAGMEISSQQIPSLLQIARKHLNEGSPSHALQAVVTALRISGGEQAVLQALSHAHKVHQDQLRDNAAADELTTLFAECAIAEASGASMPSHSLQSTELFSSNVSHASSSQYHETEQMDITAVVQSTQSIQDPILAESGRMQVVMDASSDGSSFTCFRCGGVVGSSRRDEHLAFWCSRPP
ncbi:hypothetical protein O6H91_13G085800 [Diphasiastrum complanatum]|uniref:Uncharacterized protein n=1 Tax=Diphasiastrum complanatum TaxID=34168 RepID=A0ACC2BX26_DIPCM|nr:hypothetical protein O6H91_13G085800 [Diphasiastrum complanatum]